MTCPCHLDFRISHLQSKPIEKVTHTHILTHTHITHTTHSSSVRVEMAEVVYTYGHLGMEAGTLTPVQLMAMSTASIPLLSDLLTRKANQQTMTRLARPKWLSPSPTTQKPFPHQTRRGHHMIRSTPLPWVGSALTSSLELVHLLLSFLEL